MLIHHAPKQCEGYWLPIPFASFSFTFPPERHRVPSLSNWTVREGMWNPGTIRTGAEKKSLSVTGVRKLDRPVRSEQLCRLHYPGSLKKLCFHLIFISVMLYFQNVRCMMCDYISSARTLSLATSSLYSCTTFDAAGRAALSQALSKYFAPSVVMNTYCNLCSCL